MSMNHNEQTTRPAFARSTPRYQHDAIDQLRLRIETRARARAEIRFLAASYGLVGCLAAILLFVVRLIT